MTLNRTEQMQRQLITASVAPWKTEQVGFEVSGRVDFVIEPNEEVRPQIPSESAPPATPLASVNREQFEIAVDTALANVQVVERRLQANQVSIEQRWPTAILSAEVELELAESENNRISNLAAQNAASRSEFDNARTNLNLARLAVTTAKTQLAQAEAEQLSLQAEVASAKHALDEAKRNLRNTILYSSFRGIISQVHTVPGSYVGPGDPVVTVQMMDPMVIQFEVSASDSRRYPRGDVLTVLVPDENGQRFPVSGMVYNVDSVADPDSRTYTVTLHIRNPQNSKDEDSPVVQTENLFPLNIGPMISGDERIFVEQRCLHQLGGATVVWKVTNRQWNRPTNPADRILKVEPVEVICGNEIIPLLGQWNFVPVQFVDPELIDVENDLITDQLSASIDLEQGEFRLEDWTVRKVHLNQKDWLLRSGDVVQVAINGDPNLGYFVPMKSILNENGRTYLHIVEATSNGDSIARRVEVVVQYQDSVAERAIQIRVVPVEEGSFGEGDQVVIGGVHYLKDGDQVRVVPVEVSN